MSLILIFQFEYQICAKYTPQSNNLVLISCHASRSSQKPNLGTSNTCKHVSNLRTFQSKWLLINPTFVTFLTDFVPFKEISISPKVQIQIPLNLVEVFFTKLSSSCNNLSFIWLLDCYQISYLLTLLHAENCCTIADKIYSKTKAFLIQFSWKLYNILYHKSRACTPIFIPIQ